MTIEEVKVQVTNIAQLLCGGLAVDSDSIHCDNWELLADEIADYARHIQICGSRIAGYAGYARREANK